MVHRRIRSTKFASNRPALRIQRDLEVELMLWCDYLQYDNGIINCWLEHTSSQLNASSYRNKTKKTKNGERIKIRRHCDDAPGAPCISATVRDIVCESDARARFSNQRRLSSAIARIARAIDCCYHLLLLPIPGIH